MNSIVGEVEVINDTLMYYNHKTKPGSVFLWRLKAKKLSLTNNLKGTC